MGGKRNNAILLIRSKNMKKSTSNSKAAPQKSTTKALKIPKKPRPAHLLKSLPAPRHPKLPFLHKKRYYIPLLALAITAILFLLALPLLPQAQSAAQNYTTNHPAVAKLVPKSFQPPDLGVPITGNWLVIPKASIKLPIVEGASIDVLIKEVGVWHQTGDIGHNYVIAGHRLQYYRTVNQSLYHLNLLQVSDEGIYVVTNGVQHAYKVTSSQVIDRHDVAILKPSTTPMLTIYTCNDFFNRSRLTVTAMPIGKN